VLTKWHRILGTTGFEACLHDILTLACALCGVTVCWFGRMKESRRTCLRSLAAMYFIFYSMMMHCGKGTEDSILQREDGFEDVL
jgi:hypothetical protein